MSNKLDKEIISPVENSKNNKTSQEDDQLLVQAKLGDRDAFNRLMLKYHRRIFNVAFRIFGNYDQADEVAQDVFIRAYRGISRFKQKSSFSTWLYAITVNLSRNRMKKNYRLTRLTTSLDEAMDNSGYTVKKEIADTKLTPDRALLDKEKEIQIQEAIESLDKDFRLVIILRDIQMLGYEEISEILNANIGTVKSRIYRARQILQEKLKGLI